jgi:RNA polymerase sigma-70 factor (ECF subfamily)
VSELAGGPSRHTVRLSSMPPRYLGISALDGRSPAGNPQRVIELYELLRPSLRAYLCSRGLSQDYAEDVIQETFLRLVRHIVRHGPEENLRGWLFRVARNISVDLHRLERRWFGGAEGGAVLQGRVDPAPNPEQKIILEERRREFEDACAQLTPKQRRCVLLRAEGLRYREIAVVLGVSVQRVGEMMQRAISLLDVEA